MRLWPRRISIPRINCTHATQRTQPLARAPFRAPFSYLEERRDKDGGEGERGRGDDEEKEKRKGTLVDGNERKKKKKKKEKIRKEIRDEETARRCSSSS